MSKDVRSSFSKQTRDRDLPLAVGCHARPWRCWRRPSSRRVLGRHRRTREAARQVEGSRRCCRTVAGCS